MSIANTAQAEHWNTGPSVAHWVANQARYDRMHAPFTALILGAAAPRPGGNVLDVGCGCGGTTLAAARLVAPGQALGLDLSGPMLARARADAEAAGLANVAFLQGDAQVQRLEPASFEVVISRFGVMFFADPVAAFANIRSATRPAGGWCSRAGSRWPPTSGCSSPGRHSPSTFGLLPPSPPTGPACSRSPSRTGSARSWPRPGWRDTEITSEHASILVGGGGTVDDAVEFLRTATQGRTMLAGADPATADRALASVRAALVPYTDANGVHLDAAVWLVQAVAP